MKLTVEAEAITLQPIEIFRQSHQLPDRFGIHLFYPGMGLNAGEGGRLWEARETLDEIESAVVAGVDVKRSVDRLPNLPDEAAQLLRAELLARVEAFDLNNSGIDVIEQLLQDRLRPVVYAAIQAHYQPGRPLPTLADLQAETLSQSAMLGAESRWESPNGKPWTIRILFGLNAPIGLRIEVTPEAEPVWVLDLAARHPAVPLVERISFAIGTKLGLN